VTGIFDELRKQNNNQELSDELKDKFLEQIDIEKNQEGYYLDAFGERISFNGIRQLKKPYTKLNLNTRQQQEIIACHEDYFYFRRNYCKILTKSGIGRPEPREYQVRLENELVQGDDVLAFFPRQCIHEDTIINKDNNETIKDLYKRYSYRSTNIKDDLFIDTIEILDKNELTYNTKGKIKINYLHKTKKLPLFEIILENGLSLKGSNKHVIIDENYNEIYLEDSLNKNIITKKGISKVQKVINYNKEVHMYDIGIDSIDELYFSNDILSHNSGKTVTIAIYLLHCALTRNNINIGIAANVVSLAQEVLDKIKKIFIELPLWLQPGLVTWNKQSIEFDNGNKIMIAASNSDAFRGFSLSILYVDECIFKDTLVTILNENNIKETITVQELYKNNSNNIKIKTSNGFKDFKSIKKVQSKNNLKITLDNNEYIQVTNTHKFFIDDKFIKSSDLKIDDYLLYKNRKTKIKNIEKIIEEDDYYDIIDVQDGHHYTANNIENSNCAFIKNNLFEEFMDSVMPSMAAIQNSQVIFSSTANGLNSWYHMVTGASKKAKETLTDEDIIIQDDGTEISVKEYYERNKGDSDDKRIY